MTRRGPLVAVIVIGVGLVAAPAIFQMFTRAPKGGQMLNEFEPFMTDTKVSAFRGYMRTIGEAEEETASTVRPAVEAGAGGGKAEVDRSYPQLAAFHDRWPVIDGDMNGMLDTMAGNLDNFAAVNALPPFPLFPWFFVLPGLFAAGLGVAALRRPSRPLVIAIGVLGIGVAAAPAIFQMFSRAPLGGEMIDEFGPLMREQRVATIQGYFLSIGAAEGELRTQVLPALAATGDRPPTPAIDTFLAEWPNISNEMAPMIGAMSDNLDNYAAVAALPPFPLFPWFFVAPGLMLVALAGVSLPRGPAAALTPATAGAGISGRTNR